MKIRYPFTVESAPLVLALPFVVLVITHMSEQKKKKRVVVVCALTGLQLPRAPLIATHA